jgi:hypothetical protein
MKTMGSLKGVEESKPEVIRKNQMPTQYGLIPWSYLERTSRMVILF